MYTYHDTLDQFFVLLFLFSSWQCDPRLDAGFGFRFSCRSDPKLFIHLVNYGLFVVCCNFFGFLDRRQSEKLEVLHLAEPRKYRHTNVGVALNLVNREKLRRHFILANLASAV